MKGNPLRLIPRSVDSDDSVDARRFVYPNSPYSPDVRALHVNKKKSNLKKISKYDSLSKTNVDLPNDDAYFRQETGFTTKNAVVEVNIKDEMGPEFDKTMTKDYIENLDEDLGKITDKSDSLSSQTESENENKTNGTKRSSNYQEFSFKTRKSKQSKRSKNSKKKRMMSQTMAAVRSPTMKRERENSINHH